MRARLLLALLVLALLAGAVWLLRAGRAASAPPPLPLEEPPRAGERAAVELAPLEVEPRREPSADGSATRPSSARGPALAHGRVLDARTGEPVGELELFLDGEGRHWKGASDAEGRFDCPRAELAPGTWITLIDGGSNRPVSGEPRRLERELGADEELVLRARIGPTFRFRLVRPPESFAPLGETPALLVRVRNLRPEHAAPGADPDSEGPNPFAAWEALGTANEARLRYPLPAETIEPGLALAEVRTQNHLFGARLVLDSWVGVQPVREVVLQPSSILQGRIEDEQGQPIEGATARVEYKDELPGDLPERASSDRAGTFFVQVFDPARVERLVVEKEGRETVVWRITLRLGETSGQRFVLKPR